MRFLLPFVLLALSCEAGGYGTATARILPPPAGSLYHGVYPGGSSGWEDDITPADVASYEQIVNKRVAWVYFSHNWFAGTAFPMAMVNWIREMGAVPYIRLMLREAEEGVPNRFDIDKVIAGGLDAELHAWMRAAREYGSPLVVEFGTECNGDWFPWNGVYHGGGTLDGFGDPSKPDGPERFVAAYRRIVMISRAERARNITWVFHVNANGWPAASWNRFENYYPGNAFVHWIGVSAYGPQSPMDTDYESFREQMDACYQRLVAMAPTKPIFVAEFGATRGSPLTAEEVWAGAALDDILGGRWPKLMGFSWWNERWQNDDDPSHDSDMRVQDSPALAAVFRSKLAAAGEKVVERPVVR